MVVGIMPLAIIIDTNFIAVPAQFGVDIFAEAERILERSLEFIILSTAFEELERKLATASSKTEERHFRIAKELAKRCKIVGPEGIPFADTVDNQILEYAREVKGVLATNDKALRKKAKSLGIPVLILRGQKRLSLYGSIL